MSEAAEETVPRKARKIQKYCLEFKKEVIEYAEKHGNRPSSRQFQVDERRIREWRSKKNEIANLVAIQDGRQRSRLNGGGRKSRLAKGLKKGRVFEKYSLEFKKEVIEDAEKYGNRPTSRRLGVSERRIREWRSKKSEIENMVATEGGKARSKLTGGGRKPLSSKLEEELMEWITNMRSSGELISRKLIIQQAERTYRLMNNDSVNNNFKASKGWLSRFMRRNGLSLTQVEKKKNDGQEIGVPCEQSLTVEIGVNDGQDGVPCEQGLTVEIGVPACEQSLALETIGEDLISTLTRQIPN